MRKAFTLIELLVTITIIALLATLVSLSFSKSQRAARDARRQSDSKTYVAALEKYRLTAGSYFVALREAAPNACTGLQLAATNANCTGAEGASYGRINYASGKEDSTSYSSTSIGQALLSLGFIDKVAQDPLSKKENTADEPDYVLVRCTQDGKQSKTETDSGFAIWTQLERMPTLVQETNNSNACGGMTTFDGDFASGKMQKAVSDDGYLSGITGNWVAAGGGSVGVVASTNIHSRPAPTPTSSPSSTPTAPPPVATPVTPTPTPTSTPSQVCTTEESGFTRSVNIPQYGPGKRTPTNDIEQNIKESAVIAFNSHTIKGATLGISRFDLDDIAFITKESVRREDIISFEEDWSQGPLRFNYIRTVVIPSDSYIIYDSNNGNFSGGAVDSRMTTIYKYKDKQYTIPGGGSTTVRDINTQLGLPMFAYDQVNLPLLAAHGYQNASTGRLAFKVIHVVHGGGHILMDFKIDPCS